MIKKMILGSMQTNCYIVYNEQKECIIIDPATNGQKISKFINENELSLKAILLTHGHFDHIAAVDYLEDRFHCPIYAAKETQELIKNDELNLSTMVVPFVVKSNIIPVENEIEISGFHIKWFLLEGHCQGSSMIYIEDENALFSGDVLFAGSIGRFDFPTSSSLQTKKTIARIKEMDFDARLLPGHGEESTLQHEIATNPYFQ